MRVSLSSRTRRSMALAAIVVFGPAVLAAQTPMNVSVTVNTALSIAVDRALLFGTLTPGGTRTIGASDETSAGIYRITGTAGASVTMSVTFPACLRTTPGACVPASDPSIDQNEAHWSQSASGGVHTALVGAGTLTGTGTLNGTGDLYVWIGSRVQVPAATTAGTYQGTVTMTANY